MSGTWRTLPLGELADSGKLLIQTGPFGSQLHQHDYRKVGIPVIPTEAIGHRRLRTDGIPRIEPEKAEELGRHRLKAGDILFARRGVQATGYSAIVEPQHEGWICGTGAILLRLLDPEIDPVFLSFVLASDESIAWLKQHAVGAVMPNLNDGILRRFPLSKPPIKEQKRIADILGTLDDKIELNRRMNETLEALARRLFKSWFVDFDPVHAKSALRRQHPKLSNADLSRRALPNLSPDIAELFPDGFEESTLGPIPKGWQAGTVGDIGDNPRRGVQPSEIAPSTAYIALEHMPRRCIALADWGHADEVASGKFRFNRGEILFGKLRPYFHKVGVPAVDGVCSTDVLVIAPKAAHWMGVLLGHVSSDELVAHTDTSSTGTKMPRTNWADIARFEIVVPSREVAASATLRIRDFVDRIHSNIFESKELTRTRDKLLPRLLSGELLT